MKTLAPAALATVAVALLTGCPRRPPIRPDAFDKGQKGAVLSILAQPRITAWAAAGSTGPELDAAPVVAELRPVVMEALAKSGHFSLVPEAKVLAAKGYAAQPDARDPAGFLSPPGYKPVRKEELYPTLAKEVGADMGMAVALSLMYRVEDGAAAVIVSVGAIDLKGRGVWKGGATGITDRAVDVRTASARQRIDAFKDAAQKAMALLEENLAAQIAVEGATRRSDR
jgi:hypothetical protein